MQSIIGITGFEYVGVDAWMTVSPSLIETYGDVFDSLQGLVGVLPNIRYDVPMFQQLNAMWKAEYAANPNNTFLYAEADIWAAYRCDCLLLNSLARQLFPFFPK